VKTVSIGGVGGRPGLDNVTNGGPFRQSGSCQEHISGVYRMPCFWLRVSVRLAVARRHYIPWHCATCGQIGYGSDGERPTSCKRALTAGRL
jgi:hypothetical protein